MKDLKRLFLCVAAFAACNLSFAVEALKPCKLTVGDFLENPLGMNIGHMGFNWKLPDREVPTYQSAYRVRVASSLEKLSEPDIWDSGKIDSCQSVYVPYGGRSLESSERIYWQVKVWDENGNESLWSDPAFVEAGLLSNADWGDAKWLKMGSKNHTLLLRQPPFYIRKDFSLEKTPVRARLYIASKGVFKSYINGAPTGDDVFATGWTDYKTRVQANTYDITNLVKKGANAIGVILTDGWYCGRINVGYFGKNLPNASHGPQPEMIAKILVEFEDGSRKVIDSDSSWLSGRGAVLFADIYDGEAFDARTAEEMADWAKPGYIPPAKFSFCNTIEQPVGDKPLIDARRNTQIKTILEMPAKKLSQPEKGRWIFDFGQNMVGSVRVKIKAPRGTTVKLRYAEMLNDDGTLYVANYRSAESTDRYIAKGSGTEIYTPLFTFHGFRYLEITGLPEGYEPGLSDATGLVWHNQMAQTGYFACSNAMLNQLQSNIQWGQRGNFFSVPTDCPQRDERLGWTGDAQVFAPTAAYNMDVSAFFYKWLQDMRDCQKPDGLVPDIIPGRGSWGIGSPAWADAMVTIPMTLYERYGDKRVLADNYEAMKKWFGYVLKTSKNLIRPEAGYGDWLQPYSEKTRKNPNDSRGDSSVSLIGTAYFARCADILSYSAEILGNKADAKTYADWSKKIKEAFVKTFVKPDGTVGSGLQTEQAIALEYVLVGDLKVKAAEKLKNAVKAADGHLRTGFVGTPLIPYALSRNGALDMFYKMLLKRTYPSWLFSIDQGATTMWERWNSYTKKDGFGNAAMNSFNHYAYGAVGQWMYENIGGIAPCAKNAGYKTTVFAPKPFCKDIKSANASLETPYGKVSSVWNVDRDNVMTWEVAVAPNSYGKIVFPSKNPDSVSVNGIPLKDFAAKNSLKISETDGFVSINKVRNGNYFVKVKL